MNFLGVVKQFISGPQDAIMPMPIKMPINMINQQQTNSANYHQGLQNANIGGNGIVGAGGTTVPVMVGAGGYVPAVWQQYPGQLQGQSLQQVQSIPVGTVYVSFIDASGQLHALLVDRSFVSAMDGISQYHNQCITRMGMSPPSQVPAIKMVEGEFSFDEMEKAEQMIEELEGV